MQSFESNAEEEDDEGDENEDFEEDVVDGVKVKGRSRRELPAQAVTILKEWLLSEEHFTHPYPTAQDQAHLMRVTGIGKKQLKNWFTNARRRIWKPLIKKHEDAHGDGGGVVGSSIPFTAATSLSKNRQRPTQPHRNDTGYGYTRVDSGAGFGDPRGQARQPPSRQGLHSIQSMNTFTTGMPKAPSVGMLGEGVTKTDSMAFLEVILKDAASDTNLKQGDRYEEFGRGPQRLRDYDEGSYEQYNKRMRSNNEMDHPRRYRDGDYYHGNGHMPQYHEYRSSNDVPSYPRDRSNGGYMSNHHGYVQDHGQARPSGSNLSARQDLIKRVSSHELVSQTEEVIDNQVIDTAVRVHKFAKCSFCVEGNVDTQLRPCGHLFHGRCLKPWLQASTDAPPCCLQCSTPITSCVFVITSSCEEDRPPMRSSRPSTSYMEQNHHPEQEREERRQYPQQEQNYDQGEEPPLSMASIKSSRSDEDVKVATMMVSQGPVNEYGSEDEGDAPGF